MKKIIMVLSVILFAVSLLMAAPVKNRNAANCIKRYYETYGKYNFVKIEYQMQLLAVKTVSQQ